jgi:hypothetical protein
MDVNSDKLNAFMGKMVGDFGAALNASLMLVGDKLGLYKTLAAKGPMNSAELAKATGTAERYVREWLATQAASGYIEYDATREKFSMQPEQALALANEDSPVFMGAIGNLVAATFLDEPKITEAFTTGKGVGWNRRSECLFCGTARFFRTGYKHHLVQEWLPALDGVVEKLKRGAKVADVGCGHGVSTRLMAEAFPNSRFFGFDYHERRPGLASACASTSAPPRTIRRKDMTSSASSIACTTWAIPSAPPNMCARRWRTTALACLSSPSPTTAWKTISTRSGVSTTLLRP